MKRHIKYFFLVAILLLLMFSLSSFGQQNLSKQTNTIFSQAKIRMDKYGKLPEEIRFEEGKQTTVESFFKEYKTAFNLSDDNEFISFKVFTDQLGQTHHRFKQYYKGIEIDGEQYLLHEENGLVIHAHGKLIHGLHIEVTPTLSEQEALKYALDHINAEFYMWENKENEALIKRELNDPEASFYPTGELKISNGKKERIAENFRLVYRFDIYAQNPLGRYYVDVDAKTGEVINKISRIKTGDVIGEGLSQYNGIVPIMVSDFDFPAPSRWHLDTWNSFGGSGDSWWDSQLIFVDGLLIGGYGNGWYEVLDTDSIPLVGTDHTLTFYHRYAVERPGGEPAGYDGWDGMNVRISSDGGETWQVLINPSPAYYSSSLWSFGFSHDEGPGIPGWAGTLNDWTKVSFDLSSFAGQTIQLRFAFASDAFTSTWDEPVLFGWQIDDIIIASSAETLYSNNGVAAGMTATNMEIKFIEGNYRLREAGRGGGISTYNMRHNEYIGSWNYGLSVDFVDEDSSFTDEEDQPGVTAHWAAEATYDYFLTKHDRNSYDNLGARIISYVNWIEPNAFWDGTFMVFGDDQISNSFPTLDAVGHEFTHGVVEHSANLTYLNEEGALEESFCDIFAESIESFAKSTEPDWLMGGDFDPFRSLKDPNVFENPDTYQGNYWDPQGEVHTNSGVQNYWFYLLSEGGSGVNDNGDAYLVMGVGLEDAGQIAYRNLTVYLLPLSEYFDAGRYSVQAAFDLFGENSAEHQTVIEAWYAVGIYIEQKIDVSSDTLKFSLEIGNADTSQMFISNNGLDTLKIYDIQISGTHFQLTDTIDFPFNLNHKDNFTLNVAFSTTTLGLETDTLNIFCNDPRTPNKSVILVGEGLATDIINLANELIPEKYNLYQNYPNPFNPSTTIEFTLPKTEFVELKVYNILGKEVTTLVSKKLNQGNHTFQFDGRNLASGIYYYQIIAGEYTEVKKMVLMK